MSYIDKECYVLEWNTYARRLGVKKIGVREEASLTRQQVINKLKPFRGKIRALQKKDDELFKRNWVAVPHKSGGVTFERRKK